MTDTFLLFAQPLLQELPSDGIEQAMQDVLMIARAAWNAVVLAGVGETKELQRVRERVAGNPELASCLESLLGRKRELFADDERLIGAWKLTMLPNGTVRLQADEVDTRAVGRD